MILRKGLTRCDFSFWNLGLDLLFIWQVAWKVDQLTGLEAGAGETLSTTK